MKLTKFGILVNKTTSLFTSIIRDSNISRGVQKLWKFRRGICFCHEKVKFISSSRRVLFFLLYRQKDINKIIDFCLPKSNCDGSNSQCLSNIYNYRTSFTIILRNNTDLNRALQWQNISKALKHLYLSKIQNMISNEKLWIIDKS